MNLLYKSIILMIFLITADAYATLSVGQIAPDISLENESGGLVDGGKWSSSSLKGKVHILFYVDPDESDLNETLTATLKKENFSKDQFASIAIINMKATWKPNFAINSILRGKQEKHPNTTYVRDLEKTIVNKWQLADDNNDVVLFDKSGKVLMSVDGKLTENQISQLIKLVKENL